MSYRSIMHRAALCATLSLAATALLFTGKAMAVDADAAQGLARQSKCFTCHAVDKKKAAIAWKDVAVKYKGDKDAEAKLYKHVTTGPKVKTDDGYEQEHPVVKSKNPDDIKNLVAWILSL